jgi:ATPase family AAA domain-containing protein 3A/B
MALLLSPSTSGAGSRSRGSMSEDARNALNALLYRTGEASSRFMLVLATNRPGDLDRAVGDRVDEAMGACVRVCVRVHAHLCA